MIYTKDDTREISFPLGGIGAGSVGLSGCGSLIDWELFNRPAKGSLNGYSHIAVRTRDKDGRVCARVLNGDHVRDLIGQYSGARGHSGYGYGPASGTMAGLPHFREWSFRGEYPVAELSFGGEDFPAECSLTAFSPLIPMNADDSGMPAAFFTVTMNNPTEDPLEVSAVFTLRNPFPSTRNEAFTEDGVSALRLVSAGADPASPAWGELVLATDAPRAVQQPYWYRGGWQDGIQTYWRELSEFRSFTPRTYPDAGRGDHAVLSCEAVVEPHGIASFRFVLAWYVPTCTPYWEPPQEGVPQRTWKTWYSTRWPGALAVARDALTRWDSLWAQTDDFRRALFASSLDPAVIDAASANLSTLKTPTCLRLEDGSFWGWEGCSETAGSCPGTCTHVWNYAYAMPFLFPSLERSIRELDYAYNQCSDGAMRFRISIPPAQTPDGALPCADGQFGGVLKVYREWKLSGDTEWLRSLWPRVKKALEYAWSPASGFEWDKDKDGVLEGRQHHTLDMELFGPSAWLEGFYIAALEAAARMAEALGEAGTASEYRALAANGKRFTETELFNGKWYAQKVDLHDRAMLEHFGQLRYWNDEAGELKYQIGGGCEIDQMCAQWHANILGLGDVFDPEHRAAALDSLVKYNVLDSFRDFANTWRVFALDDEAGALICTYPEGTYKPVIPLPYNEESMNGFEYQLAGLLLSERRTEDGLRLVRAIRGRYAGHNRNPWNEIECGSNYARSMASWALIPILSGFTFDMTKHEIGFAPLTDGDFRTVWSVAGCWGVFSRRNGVVRIEKHGGSAPAEHIRLPFLNSPCTVVTDAGEGTFADGAAHVPAGARTIVVRAAGMTREQIAAVAEQVLVRRRAAAERLTDTVLLTDYASLVRNGVWTDALQRALDEHERVRVPASAEPYDVDRTVVIPSHRVLEGDGEGSVLRMRGMDTILLRNDSAADGTHAPIASASGADVTVRRLRIEENAPRRMGYGMSGKYDAARSFYGVSTCFFFNNLDGLTLEDLTFVRTAGFAVQAGDLTDGVFQNVRFESCFADGLHLNGNSRRLLIRGVRGQCGDDLVALNMYDWRDSSVDFGPMDTVLCEDLELSPDSRYKAFRIEPGVYRYDDGSIADCGLYNAVIRRVNGIRTFKMYFQTPRYKLGTSPEWGAVGSADNVYFEDMTIDLDGPIDRFPEYTDSDPVRGSFAAFEIGANVGSLTLSDIRLELYRDRYPYSYLLCAGPKSVRRGDEEIFDPYLSCAVGALTLERIAVNGVPVTSPDALRALVREIAFDDVNGDGRSTGKGTIERILC